MNRTTKIQGLSALTLSTLFLLWLSSRFNQPFPPFLIAILVATGLQSLITFAGLAWSLPRSNQAFYSIFVGDALLRLAGLGLATYWVSSRHLPFTGPLLSLGFAYLLLSVIQVPFFYRAN